MTDLQKTDTKDAEFLDDPNEWTHGMAERLAKNHGIDELTEAHWELIKSLRAYYFEHKVPPALSNICWINDKDKTCLTDLFKTSKIAWIISGLPDPGEEAKSYMSDW